MSNEIEIWKVIDGYEDYQVSSLGRVKSLKYGKEVILSYGISRGYLSIVLCKNGIRKCFTIHVLVAMVFKGHIPDGTHNVCVDHIDNNKFNNRLDNLNLVSQRENASKDRKGGASNFVGVYYKKRNRKWCATIHFKGRYIYLGLFELEIDAKNAYDKALEEWKQGLDLNVLYPKKVKTSQYEGVSWHNQSERWEANYKGRYLGRFKTELEAYEARENYIKQLTN